MGVIGSVFNALDSIVGIPEEDRIRLEGSHTETTLFVRFREDGTVDEYEFDIDPEGS